MAYSRQTWGKMTQKRGFSNFTLYLLKIEFKRPEERFLFPFSDQERKVTLGLMTYFLYIH